MPRGNKTGPEGMGPKTGRGAGFCSGSDKPGYRDQSCRIRSGKGRGRRLGDRFRNFSGETGRRGQDSSSIRQKLQQILDRLDSITGRTPRD